MTSESLPCLSIQAVAPEVQEWLKEAERLLNNAMCGWTGAASTRIKDRAALLAHLAAHPVMQSVFAVHNKTTNILFADRDTANAFAASYGASVGLQVTEIQVVQPAIAAQAAQPKDAA